MLSRFGQPCRRLVAVNPLRPASLGRRPLVRGETSNAYTRWLEILTVEKRERWVHPLDTLASQWATTKIRTLSNRLYRSAARYYQLEDSIFTFEDDWTPLATVEVTSSRSRGPNDPDRTAAFLVDRTYCDATLCAIGFCSFDVQFVPTRLASLPSKKLPFRPNGTARFRVFVCPIRPPQAGRCCRRCRHCRP